MVLTTYSSSSCMVRIRTRVSGRASRMRRDASRPFNRGMLTSQTTTSGLVSSALRVASAPSPASPTTSMSPLPFRMPTIPSRTIVWSSATRTRILLAGLRRTVSSTTGWTMPRAFPRLLGPGIEDVPRDIDEAELRRHPPRPDNRELAVRAERAAHEVSRWLACGRGHGIQGVERNEGGLAARAPDRAVNLPRHTGAGTMVDAEAELLAIRRDREPAVAVAPRRGRDVLSRPGLAVVGRVEEDELVAHRVVVGVKRYGVHIKGPDRAVRRHLQGGPGGGRVQRAVVADLEAVVVAPVVG